MRKVRHEHGFAAAWLVVILPVMLLLTGIVVDGGIALYYGQQLDVATDAAANAATDAWDRDYWLWEGKVRLDPARADALARDYLIRNMPGARVTSVVVRPANRVTIGAAITTPRFFMRAFGITDGIAESFATAVRRDKR